MASPLPIRCAPPRRMVAALLIVAIATSGVARGGQSTVRLINDPADALATAIDLIDHAEHSVVIATYVIDSGVASATMLRHAAAASRRGVDVRLLHDAFETPLPKSWVRNLTSAGVRIHNYNPPCLWTPIALNWRLHAKLLVADGGQCILGSRNWQDSHYGVDPHEAFIDQDVIVTGQPAASAAAYFERLWHCDRSEPVSMQPECRFDLWNRGDNEASPPTLSDLLHRDDITPPRSPSACPVCPGVVTTSVPRVHRPRCAHLLVDRDCDKSHHHFAHSIDRLIDNARCNLRIETPYPAMSSRLTRRLVAAAGRGVRVELLTNSYNTIDQQDVYAAYMKRKRRLLAAGVQIREVVGKQILHSKTMTVDDDTSVIGSYNFDSRSERFNLEIAVVVHDADLTHSLRRRFDDRASRAVVIQDAGWLQPLAIGRDTTLNDRIDLFVRRLRIQICHRCL